MQEVVGSNSSEGKICFSHFTVKVQFCLGEGKAIIKDYSGTVFKAEHEKKIRALHYNIWLYLEWNVKNRFEKLISNYKNYYN